MDAHNGPSLRILGLIIGFAGIVVSLHPGSFVVGGATFIGLLGGLTSAATVLGLRKISQTDPAYTVLFYNFSLGLILSFPGMRATWVPVVNLTSWTCLLGASLCAAIFQYFVTKAFAAAPATKVSAMYYLVLVFSGIFDWVIWQKVPDRWMIIGVCLVICGGMITFLEKGQSRARQIRK